MTDTERLIAQVFGEHMEIATGTAMELGDLLAQAAQALVHSLLSDGKVFCCGDGGGALMAQMLASYLLSGCNRERPELPAINLGGVEYFQSAKFSRAEYAYAHSIKALGTNADVLVVFATQQSSELLLRAVGAAKAHDMRLIICSNAGNLDIGSLLAAEDIEIPIPTASQQRLLEMQLLSVHCLCDLVDHHLFGEQQ